MAKTYDQLSREIVVLQAAAEKVRRAEVSAAIAQINDSLAKYNLTLADLKFSGHLAVDANNSVARVARNKTASSDTVSSAKFNDDHGNTWSGRGPRPKWLRDALTKGKSLESFLGSRASLIAEKPSAEVPPAKKHTSPTAGKKVAPKYRDASTGETWTGRGHQPIWLKTAVQSGRQLDSFLIADALETVSPVWARSLRDRALRRSK